MFSKLRGSLVWIILIGVLVLIWYQYHTINKLNTNIVSQTTTIETLRNNVVIMGSIVDTVQERMNIQNDLILETMVAKKEMEDAYDDFRNKLLDDNGRMLIRIRNQISSATAGSTTSTPDGHGPGSYIYLPPEMARDITGLLRDADTIRLQVMQWQSWYCKHQPDHAECTEVTEQ